MSRILFWFLIAALVWWLLKSRTRPPAPPGPGPRAPGSEGEAEAMVDCARCGLHMPASEALRDAQGRAYCCAEHRAAGPR
jgi:uncharacterized protein